MTTLGDTLYEPTAVFSQFQGSASMTFFLLFLTLLPLFALSFLALLVFSFISFPFVVFRFLVSFIFFSFLCLIFCDRLTSVVRMRSDRYYVQYIRGSLSWVASDIIGFFQVRV